MSKTARIANLTLDEGSIIRRAPEIEHERTIAVHDLLVENSFAPVGYEDKGPFDLALGVEENRAIFSVSSAAITNPLKLTLPIPPFRSIIRDYFLICGSYFEAIKSASPSKIEAIDMGRRGIHNEGSQMLMDLFEDKAKMDMQTARRLFTLICVLHIK